MVDLRDRVARELNSLLRKAGLDNPWSDRTDASTRWLYSDGVLYEAARLRLHRELVERQRVMPAPIAAAREVRESIQSLAAGQSDARSSPSRGVSP